MSHYSDVVAIQKMPYRESAMKLQGSNSQERQPHWDSLGFTCYQICLLICSLGPAGWSLWTSMFGLWTGLGIMHVSDNSTPANASFSYHSHSRNSGRDYCCHFCALRVNTGYWFWCEKAFLTGTFNMSFTSRIGEKGWLWRTLSLPGHRWKWGH